MSERTYKIGEAAQILKLKSYVLRFWETEFPQLSPMRTDKGQRLYSESNLETLKFIRHLLHERGLTIEGARKVLQSHNEMSEVAFSSELLDEGYKNFGGEGVIPDQFEVAAEDDPTNLPSLAALARQAELAANHGILQYALEELKEISEMLKKTNHQSS